jgi:hypothetical protein
MAWRSVKHQGQLGLLLCKSWTKYLDDHVEEADIVGKVGWTGEMRNVYTILVGKVERNTRHYRLSGCGLTVVPFSLTVMSSKEFALTPVNGAWFESSVLGWGCD